MTNHLKHFCAILLLALGLSACNTVEGVGEDIEAGGGAISDTAKDTKEDM